MRNFDKSLLWKAFYLLDEGYHSLRKHVSYSPTFGNEDKSREIIKNGIPLYKLDKDRSFVKFIGSVR